MDCRNDRDDERNCEILIYILVLTINNELIIKADIFESFQTVFYWEEETHCTC